MHHRTIGTAAIILLLTLNAFSYRSLTPYKDTLRQLTALKNVKNDRKVLAELFKTDDGHIKYLIRALDDKNQQISLRAQIVLRYLGDETGMKALERWYTTQAQIVRSGPIPVPLSELDYKWIEAQSIDGAAEYIYALALDGSLNASTVLAELKKKEVDDTGTFAVQALHRVSESDPHKLLVGRNSLSSLVLKNAFFIGSNDRPKTKAHVIGFNARKNKALIEVYVDRGPLAEEWYHVVIAKYSRGWKFFSITQISVS